MIMARHNCNAAMLEHEMKEGHITITFDDQATPPGGAPTDLVVDKMTVVYECFESGCIYTAAFDDYTDIHFLFQHMPELINTVMAEPPCAIRVIGSAVEVDFTINIVDIHSTITLKLSAPGEVVAAGGDEVRQLRCEVKTLKDEMAAIKLVVSEMKVVVDMVREDKNKLVVRAMSSTNFTAQDLALFIALGNTFQSRSHSDLAANGPNEYTTRVATQLRWMFGLSTQVTPNNVRVHFRYHPPKLSDNDFDDLEAILQNTTRFGSSGFRESADNDFRFKTDLQVATRHIHLLDAVFSGVATINNANAFIRKYRQDVNVVATIKRTMTRAEVKVTGERIIALINKYESGRE